MESKKENLNWNLEKILEPYSLEDLICDYSNKLQQLIDCYDKDIFASKENLEFFHKKHIEFKISSNKIFNYLNNKHNVEMANPTWFQHMQHLKASSIGYYQKLSDYTEKAIKNKEKIKVFLKDKNLSEYKRFYELIFRTETHNPPTIVKKFMASYLPMKSSYEKLFDSIIEQELQTKSAKDSKNKSHKITNYDSFSKTQYSQDRTLRKNAYLNWYKSVEGIKESLTKILYYQLLEQNIEAKSNNFDGFYESKIFDDELPTSYIPYVYKKISSLSSEYKKYKKTQKQIIKKTYKILNLKPWDMRMPIIKKNDYVSIEEAKEMTIGALSILGEKYIKNIKKAFDERWIDWEQRINKTSGAYCIGGCLGIDYKYILLNYTYKLKDVYTLVHELGHAMHAIEFCENQTVYADTSIFLAEIPSTLNELFLSFYLLEKYKDNPKKKLEIYDNLISNFFSTTISQVILSDWEYEANELVNSGRILNYKEAKLIYKTKQEKYKGNSITKPLSAWKDLGLSFIITIPHFYSGEFYVYKYAIGQISSLIIFIEIYNNKNKDYLNKYLDFLKLGSSKSNLEALEMLNINLEKSSTWSKVKQEVTKWIKEFIELSKQI